VERRDSIVSSLSGTRSSLESLAEMAANSERMASLLSFAFVGAMVHE
jgi:hypothetical protein